ncbi:MAG: argininosuccinate synthase [Dehalococcoidia bacterium]|nr:argininosuccinate synthase [Dehalococcoidia bacterium]
MPGKVVLAYSGGLDTSAAIKWLNEKYGLDVITLTVDVGNEKDFLAARDKALAVGAVKAIVKDAKQELVTDYIFPALKAGAVYEGRYPLATALSRPLMARLLAEVALAEGADAIAHGCTGKGNDQVRFEVSVAALAPHLKVIAPAREWGMTREDTIKYALSRGIPVPVKSGSAYSIDENLWGRSIECGVLEDPWTEPPEDVYAWTASPAKTPDQPAYIVVGFERGAPVSLDGVTIPGLGLIEKIHEVAGRHGVGRIDHVENRLVGIKSREIYEAPAATVLVAAHQALEDLTLTKEQARFKARVAPEYADLVYNGQWFTALRQDLDAFIESTQRFVTGEVRLKLFKGQCCVIGRRSPFSLYSHGLATYDQGDHFDQGAAPGFIHLWGLPVKTQAQVQQICTLPANKPEGV